MTREEQRQLKEQKKLAKIQARINASEIRRQEKLDARNWDKMVARAKSKGAWIEE